MSKTTCIDYIIDDVATWGYHGVIDSLVELLVEDKLDALKRDDFGRAAKLDAAADILETAKLNIIEALGQR